MTKEGHTGEYFIAFLLFTLVAIVFLLPAVLDKGLFGGIIYDNGPWLEFLPWELKNIRSFYRLEWPLWDHSRGLGVPHLANLQSNPFYPLKWLIYILPYWITLDIYLVLRIILAMFFCFILSRSFKMSGETSFYSAVVFGLNGYFMGWVNVVNLNVDILLPLFIHSIVCLVRRRTLGASLYTVVVLYLLFSGGHPSSSIAALFMGFTLLIYLEIQTPRPSAVSPFHLSAVPAQAGRFTVSRHRLLQLITRLTLPSLILIISILISLAFIMPFIEYLPRSWNYHRAGVGGLHLNIDNIITLVMPWFYGNSREVVFTPISKLGLMPPLSLASYQEVLVPKIMPYMGFLALLTYIIGLLTIRKLGRISPFFALFSIFSLGIIFGITPYSLLGKLPVFENMVNFKYFMPLFFLSVAVLGGMAMERVIKRRVIRWAFVILLIFELGLSNLGHERMWLYSRDQKGIGDRIFSPLREMDVQHASLADFFTGTVSYHPFPEIPLDNQKTEDRRQKTEVRGQNSKFLYPSRAIDLSGLFPPNIMTLYEREDLYSHDPLYPRTYWSLFNALNGHSEEEGFRHFFKNFFPALLPRALDSQVLDILNIRYIISSFHIPPSDLINEIFSRGEIDLSKGGMVYITSFTINGITKPTLFMHPGSSLKFRQSVPSPGFEFHYSMGMHPQTWDKRGDGVEFHVDIVGEGEVITRRIYLDPKGRESDRKWIEGLIDLDRFSGMEVDIYLKTLPSDKGDGRYDWAGWGDLYIEDRDSEAKWMEKSKDGMGIFENKDVKGRAFFVDRATFLQGEDKTLERMLRPEVDLLSNALIQIPSSEVRSQKSEIRSQKSSVTFINYLPNSVEIMVSCERPSYLILSDLYYPGWKVYIDGRETRLLKAYYLLKCVPVKPGRHLIHFVYSPLSFRLGLYISLATFMVVVIIWGVSSTRGTSCSV